jgi:integrase
MQGLSSNILEKYSYDEICQLQSLLKEIKKQKRIGLGKEYNINRFYSEYKSYIEKTFSQSYLRSVTLSFFHLINFFTGDKLLRELNVKDAEDFKSYIMSKAPKGYLVYLRTVKAAFNVAINWELISYNPVAKIKFKKVQQSRPRFLTRSELQKILEKTNCEMMKLIFLFAFYSGCRLNEVINLMWKHIDFKNKILTVGDLDLQTKNGKTRQIPLAEEIFNILKDRVKNQKLEAYIFAKLNSGYRYNRDYVSRSFLCARSKAGLSEDIHFHTLRHSFASNLAIKGVPIITLKELLGHGSIISTQIYSHSNLEAKRDAISKFDEFSLAV